MKTLQGARRESRPTSVGSRLQRAETHPAAKTIGTLQRSVSQHPAASASQHPTASASAAPYCVSLPAPCSVSLPAPCSVSLPAPCSISLALWRHWFQNLRARGSSATRLGRNALQVVADLQRRSKHQLRQRPEAVRLRFPAEHRVADFVDLALGQRAERRDDVDVVPLGGGQACRVAQVDDEGQRSRRRRDTSSWRRTDR